MASDHTHAISLIQQAIADAEHDMLTAMSDGHTGDAAERREDIASLEAAIKVLEADACERHAGKEQP